jgi:hypothetical protein
MNYALLAWPVIALVSFLLGWHLGVESEKAGSI